MKCRATIRLHDRLKNEKRKEKSLQPPDFMKFLHVSQLLSPSRWTLLQLAEFPKCDYVKSDGSQLVWRWCRVWCKRHVTFGNPFANRATAITRWHNSGNVIGYAEEFPVSAAKGREITRVPDRFHIERADSFIFLATKGQMI